MTVVVQREEEIRKIRFEKRERKEVQALYGMVSLLFGKIVHW